MVWSKRRQWSEDTIYSVGQPLCIQNRFNKLWKPAIIFKKAFEPRSYLVKDDKGKIYRRYNRWIKKRLINRINFNITDNDNKKTDENKERDKRNDNQNINDEKEENDRHVSEKKNDENKES